MEKVSPTTREAVVLMKSIQCEYSHRECFLNTIAPAGRLIDPCVFSAAQDIASQAVCYAGKFLADSCVVINLLEEAAATVSDAIRAKEVAGIAPIQDVHRYLFRVFLRKVAEARRSEAPFERASRVHSDLSNPSQVEELDSQLLLDRILAQFDSVTREMILRRIEGHPWHEIALEFGLSNHAARVRFSKAVQRLRSHMETVRNGVSESTVRSTKKYPGTRDSSAQRVVAFREGLSECSRQPSIENFTNCSDQRGVLNRSKSFVTFPRITWHFSEFLSTSKKSYLQNSLETFAFRKPSIGLGENCLLILPFRLVEPFPLRSATR
jgi:DNA-directed RNA polymerase specialized sigma24 family protein